MTAEAAPHDYAMTQNNLGAAYRELPAGDRAANLARAIDCYTQALRFRTPEAAPLNYSTTQNNLGVAYFSLPGGDRAANLARAIDCYTEALRFFTAEAAPAQYAMVQSNLGETYGRFRGTGPLTWRAPSTATARPCSSTPQTRPLPSAAARLAASAMPISDKAAGRKGTLPTPRPSAPASSYTRPPVPMPAGNLSWVPSGTSWPLTRTAWPGPTGSPRQ